MFVASSAPTSGTVASATTSYPSAERVRALLIKAASVNCPLTLSLLDQRNLTVERVSSDGTVLATEAYAIPQQGDRDRAVDFNIDAAIHPGAAVKAYFDFCSAGERQWILINYEYV